MIKDLLIMTTGNREDYLISILRLTEGERSTKTTELANFMGISPASVSEMLKILAKEGLVKYEKYKGVALTEEGLNYARQVRKKHHVMERFLMDYLNVDRETAHKEACKMEHVISDDSMVKMCHIVGRTVDCDCQICNTPCKAVAANGTAITSSLGDLRPGDQGVISHLKSSDPETVKKLISMGFVPGREVRVDSRISDKGPRIVGLGNSTVALDQDMALSVFVDIG